MKWTDKINKRYARFSIYVIVTVLIIDIISKLADNAPEIFAWLMSGLGWIFKVAKPILIGFVMAYILQPLNDFFTDKYSKIKFLKKSSRVLGVITVLLLLVVILTLIVSAIVFSVTDQLQLADFDDLLAAISTITNSVTDFYDMLMEKLKALDIQSEQMSGYISTLSENIMGVVQQVAGGLISSITNFSGYLTTLAFGIIIGIYFMIDGAAITSYFSGVADAILKDKTNARLRSVLKDLDEVFSGYIRGQLMDVAFMILATSAAMMLTGIRLAPIIGLLTGLANLVPYLGPFVGYASIILVSLVDGRYDVMIASMIALFVIQTLDGNVIEAKFLGKSIRIHPLLVVIFLIFGNAVGGVWGMLLAVPVGAYLQKLFTNYVEKRKNAKILERAKRDSVVNERDESAAFVDSEMMGEAKESFDGKQPT